MSRWKLFPVVTLPGATLQAWRPGCNCCNWNIARNICSTRSTCLQLPVVCQSCIGFALQENVTVLNAFVCWQDTSIQHQEARILLRKSGQGTEPTISAAVTARLSEVESLRMPAEVPARAWGSTAIGTGSRCPISFQITIVPSMRLRMHHPLFCVLQPSLAW